MGEREVCVLIRAPQHPDDGGEDNQSPLPRNEQHQSIIPLAELKTFCLHPIPSHSILALPHLL